MLGNTTQCWSGPPLEKDPCDIEIHVFKRSHVLAYDLFLAKCNAAPTKVIGFWRRSPDHEAVKGSTRHVYGKHHITITSICFFSFAFLVPFISSLPSRLILEQFGWSITTLFTRRGAQKTDRSYAE